MCVASILRNHDVVSLSPVQSRSLYGEGWGEGMYGMVYRSGGTCFCFFRNVLFFETGGDSRSVWGLFCSRLCGFCVSVLVALLVRFRQPTLLGIIVMSGGVRRDTARVSAGGRRGERRRYHTFIG